MAVLSDADRSAVWADLMRDLSRAGEPVACLKADLLDAVNALDTWLSTNAATINAAIPQPARSALTTPQKARLLAAVTLKRYAGGV